MTRPFWEAGYRHGGRGSVFGGASEEIRDLVPRLPERARVLDLGCGDGRNALFLLEQGFEVTAVDVSDAAIARVVADAREARGHLDARVEDARKLPLTGPFDLIVAHGLLHLMPRAEWRGLVERMKEATAPLGYNVVAVFTDALPPPPDLEPFMLGLFREGELRGCYDDWSVELHRSYVRDDEHPGGVRHRHPVDKVVARKPGPPA